MLTIRRDCNSALSQMFRRENAPVMQDMRSNPEEGEERIWNPNELRATNWSRREWLETLSETSPDTQGSEPYSTNVRVIHALVIT